jgi:large subunit ribosomal protein L9
MQVILLERVAKLGQMGEVVNVKAGYARNFLLPRGKALRANDSNKANFEKQKAALESRNQELKGEATRTAERLDGKSFTLIRQAGDSGVLYGSVSTRDISSILASGGFTVARTQISLVQPIKTLGMHRTPVTLHPEVEVIVSINVARSEEEAERQARGEVIVADRGGDDLSDLGLEVGAALADAAPGEGF